MIRTAAKMKEAEQKPMKNRMTGNKATASFG